MKSKNMTKFIHALKHYVTFDNNFVNLRLIIQGLNSFYTYTMPGSVLARDRSTLETYLLDRI
jgi:hypothetical protein